MKLSQAALECLRTAAQRPSGHVLPTKAKESAETMLLASLAKRGLISPRDPKDG